MSKSFIYTVTDSPKRGYNRRINAYRIKRNVPVYLGCEDVNTAGYKGDKATACGVIAEAGEAGEATLAPDGYYLNDKTHSVVEV